MFSKKYEPRIGLYELTLRCNMRCIHCGSSAGEKRTDELTTKEWNNVTKQLADLNCKEITLLGGEPFLRKDWYEISKEINNYGLKITIMSNGLLINEKTIEKLVKIQPKVVSVSIDGSNSKTHDKIRQVKGSFDKSMQVIDNLKKAGITTTVVTSINKLNFKELPELKEMLRNKGTSNCNTFRKISKRSSFIKRGFLCRSNFYCINQKTNKYQGAANNWLSLLWI